MMHERAESVKKSEVGQTVPASGGGSMRRVGSRRTHPFSRPRTHAPHPSPRMPRAGHQKPAGGLWLAGHRLMPLGCGGAVAGCWLTPSH